MVDWLRPILVALAVMVGLWALLVVLARPAPGRAAQGPGRVPAGLCHPGPPTAGRPPGALAGQGRRGLSGMPRVFMGADAHPGG